MPAQLIRMFLLDGNAEGIKTLEISNRTIYATMLPRPLFSQYKQRREYKKPGVYVLMGRGTNDEPLIYIGEGDPVGERIKAHYGNRDFWTDAIVFTSKDDYLTKTQIQYLEAKLIRKADEAGQIALENANIPTLPNISEADEAEVSEFLESIFLFIKALGFTYFTPLITNVEVISNDRIYELTRRNSLIHGKMTIKNGKYVLLKDSLAKADEHNSAGNWVRNNRRKLIQRGILADEGQGVLRLLADIEFNSPSGAAVVITGGNVNGHTAWKYEGKSLADIEVEESLESDGEN